MRRRHMMTARLRPPELARRVGPTPAQGLGVRGCATVSRDPVSRVRSREIPYRWMYAMRVFGLFCPGMRGRSVSISCNGVPGQGRGVTRPGVLCAVCRLLCGGVAQPACRNAGQPTH